jgi:VanZ family protein
VKFFKLWFPVFIWAVFIFFLSGIPDLRTGFKEDFILRKIAHIAEYFILTFFLYRAFKGSFKISVSRLYVYPSAVSFLYALSDEFHQSFVPRRSCAMQDVLIDALGIIGFCLFIRHLSRKKS